MRGYLLEDAAEVGGGSKAEVERNLGAGESRIGEKLLSVFNSEVSLRLGGRDLILFFHTPDNVCGMTIQLPGKLLQGNSFPIIIFDILHGSTGDIIVCGSLRLVNEQGQNLQKKNLLLQFIPVDRAADGALLIFVDNKRFQRPDQGQKLTGLFSGQRLMAGERYSAVGSIVDRSIAGEKIRV